MAALAGLQSGDYEEGSLQVDFLNPVGDTTVKLTARFDVDTTQLRELICEAAQPTE